MKFTFLNQLRRLLLLAGIIGWASLGRGAETSLLNVSYDVTREFYQAYNAAFAAHWKKETGEAITINQSHGGSSKQARAVIDGLEADVVTMNQPLDIDAIQQKSGVIAKDWAARLPNHSVPYTSTILFVVRRGNPKQIKDWPDLVKSNVSVIIPNPKTSGNGRYSYLAAWGFALRQSAGNEAKAREFVGELFANVPVLETGGRSASSTFTQRGIGDVLLTFESEAAQTQKEAADAGLEIVVPPSSIRADNPVAWVDRFVTKHGTERAARSYLEYLFSDAGQELAAANHFRPQRTDVLARHRAQFPALELFSVEDIAQGWPQAQKVHFAEGGLFDQLYHARK